MKAIIKIGDFFVTDYHRGLCDGDVGDITLRNDMAMVFIFPFALEEVANECHGEIIYIEPPVED